MTSRRVEVLLIDGCPNTATALARARAAVKAAGVDADVRLIFVRGADDARRLRFLGSPSIRVDGLDVDPSAARRVDFGFQCRVYAVDGRVQGIPPTQWIVDALSKTPTKGTS